MHSPISEAEIRFTVARDVNWVVDLSDLQKLPEPLLETLVALDEGLRTDGRRLEATGLHMSHLGGQEFPRLVALYGAETMGVKWAGCHSGV